MFLDLLLALTTATASCTWTKTKNSSQGGTARAGEALKLADCKAKCDEAMWCTSFEFFYFDGCDHGGKYKPEDTGQCYFYDVKADKLGTMEMPCAKWDHYKCDRACDKIVMKDLKQIGPQVETEDAQGRTVVHDVNYCRHPTDFILDEEVKSVRTESVTNSYSNTKSWSETFKSKVGASVGLKWEGNFGFSKVSAELKVDTSEEHSSTTSGSSSSTNVQTTITSNEGSSTWHHTVPAFTWGAITVDWKKFQVHADYTGTAICMDSKGNEIERQKVSGTWKGAYLTQSEVSVQDKTNQCPSALECKCAGLEANWMNQGLECSDPLFGGSKFCYVRADAPCPNKSQLDLTDSSVNPTMFRKSGDPCGNSQTFAASAHFTTMFRALPPIEAAEEPTCPTLPGYSLSAPGDAHRVILDGKCGLWTCKETGTFDIGQCPAVEKEGGDCMIGGQVVKSSDRLPLIYGQEKCITATCDNGELKYSPCGNVATCEDGESTTAMDTNGICIDAECDDDGKTVYTSCVPSNIECILPNYEIITNGQSTQIHDDKGVCSEMTCTNGVLDARPCDAGVSNKSIGEHETEGSLVAPFEKVGRLMDRLGNYLTHQGFRR